MYCINLHTIRFINVINAQLHIQKIINASFWGEKKLASPMRIDGIRFLSEKRTIWKYFNIVIIILKSTTRVKLAICRQCVNTRTRKKKTAHVISVPGVISSERKQYRDKLSPAAGRCIIYAVIISRV